MAEVSKIKGAQQAIVFGAQAEIVGKSRPAHGCFVEFPIEVQGISQVSPFLESKLPTMLGYFQAITGCFEA